MQVPRLSENADTKNVGTSFIILKVLLLKKIEILDCDATFAGVTVKKCKYHYVGPL